MLSPLDLWRRFQESTVSAARVTLDLSRISFSGDFFSRMDGPARRALEAMDALEKGAIANPDEKRMVGHYWLRAPELAPTKEIREAIEKTLSRVKGFASAIHSGTIRPEREGKFRNLLVIGIGGSALGPQLAAEALGSSKDRMRPWFFDNTDPDGMDRVLSTLGGGLKETVTIVISKSGGTKETRNGMLEAGAAYRQAGLSFPRHAVAVTGEGSELDKLAKSEGWLERFPMWDWVGGRTSELAAVGLLPAYLQGLDGDGMLRGAREMDVATRVKDPGRNPAMLLAFAWHHATRGRGEKDMVVLPYKDRLLLFSRYLQQLVMESLGKELDLDGKVVHQGIAVYGNKGSTDQHSYVQQLREGVPNFFATFIEVLKDREGGSMEVEPGITSGDFLLGFLLGTRKALFEKDRESITLSIEQVSPETLGALIALYERAVGFYASLVHINAYHQPGVEAGKKAAGRVIALQEKAVEELSKAKGSARTAEEIARAIDAPDEAETIYKVLEHLAANGRQIQKEPGEGPAKARYKALGRPR